VNMADSPNSTKRNVRIVLDSNALFVPVQFKLDILAELKALLNRSYEPILISPVRQEIEKLAREGSPKMRKNATSALQFAEKCKAVEVDQGNLSTDDTILQVAREWNCPVFTNDKLLRKKLRDINVPVIYVRQKSHLQIDGRL
jgi:rRNA-processing protein FCF1